jgi:hypothetical protein
MGRVSGTEAKLEVVKLGCWTNSGWDSWLKRIFLPDEDGLESSTSSPGERRFLLPFVDGFWFNSESGPGWPLMVTAIQLLADVFVTLHITLKLLTLMLSLF